MTLVEPDGVGGSAPPQQPQEQPHKHHHGPKMTIGAKRVRIAIATLVILALIVGGAVAGEVKGERGGGEGGGSV